MGKATTLLHSHDNQPEHHSQDKDHYQDQEHGFVSLIAVTSTEVLFLNKANAAWSPQGSDGDTSYFGAVPPQRSGDVGAERERVAVGRSGLLAAHVSEVYVDSGTTAFGPHYRAADQDTRVEIRAFARQVPPEYLNVIYRIGRMRWWRA